jgi:diguanylate cyclase (GGDEF)-like protein
MPTILQGYSEDEKSRLAGQSMEVAPDILDTETPVLVTAADAQERLAGLRRTLMLPYFISVPIIVKNERVGILITGRMVEQVPFLSRLGHSDVETVQAVSALLASLLVYQQLDDANKKARTDPLTGLYNRALLESRATRILSSCCEDGRTHAFVMIDFDFFKQVNDNYGHLRGDGALKALADMLHRIFRSTDVIARIGGDEFAVFCMGIGDSGHISEIMSRLMEDWRGTDLAAEGEATFRATLSIGVSIAPRDGFDYEDLFNKADMALYESKRQGRDRYTIYDAATMER